MYKEALKRETKRGEAGFNASEVTPTLGDQCRLPEEGPGAFRTKSE